MPPQNDASDRDRNAYGRPEQARPRDRTGLPLPYDTDETELAEDHPAATVEEALAIAVRLWDDHRYFEAHELLEHVWHAAPEDDRRFWQGLIQVAVTFVHHQRGRTAGVTASAGKALANLAGFPDGHHGIDVRALRAVAEGARAAVLADPDARLALPSLPRSADGPWFALGARDHPLPTEPSWMIAARQRREAAAGGAGDPTATTPPGGTTPPGSTTPPRSRATMTADDQPAVALEQGLEPGFRFRCTTCGNLTRFDVEATERTVRYHHFDLAGDRAIEEERVLERRLDRVTCRWCNNDTVIAEPVGPDPADGA